MYVWFPLHQTPVTYFRTQIPPTPMFTINKFSLKYLLFTLCVLLSVYQLLTFTSIEGKQGMLLFISLVCTYASGVLLFLPTKRYVSSIFIVYVLIQVYITTTL